MIKYKGRKQREKVEKKEIKENPIPPIMALLWVPSFMVGFKFASDWVYANWWPSDADRLPFIIDLFAIGVPLAVALIIVFFILGGILSLFWKARNRHLDI